MPNFLAFTILIEVELGSSVITAWVAELTALQRDRRRL